jgi:Lon protease (S16) C-terminal proteolytic domain
LRRAIFPVRYPGPARNADHLGWRAEGRDDAGECLILTGQLGDVMKESAQAALSIVKNGAAAFGIEAARFDRTDIHIHVPAGAAPKDGPSAGVAMSMAVVSLMTDRTVRSDTAMTGEISLRGLVLPVGGIKEKVVAFRQSPSARSRLDLIGATAARREYRAETGEPSPHSKVNRDAGDNKGPGS